MYVWSEECYPYLGTGLRCYTFAKPPLLPSPSPVIKVINMLYVHTYQYRLKPDKLP